jgi:hypothetical protein
MSALALILGFGHVGLVEHKSTGGVFALKWVPRQPSKDACLKSEIQLLSELGSPFVGKYVKHFLWQGSTYLLQVSLLRMQAFGFHQRQSCLACVRFHGLNCSVCTCLL